LTKAVSMHARGMSQPPLRGRQAPPYRMLEDWVRLTLAGNPQLREPPAPAPERPAFGPGPSSPVSWGEESAKPLPAVPLPPLPPPAPPPATATPATAGAAPAKLPVAQAGAAVKLPTTPPPSKPSGGEPADPVDPEAFNRQYHPVRKEGPKLPE